MRTCKAGGPEAKVMICTIPLQLVFPNDLSALLCFHLLVWFVPLSPFFLASPFPFVLSSPLSRLLFSVLGLVKLSLTRRTDTLFYAAQHTGRAHPEMFFFILPAFHPLVTSALLPTPPHSQSSQIIPVNVWMLTPGTVCVCIGREVPLFGGVWECDQESAGSSGVCVWRRNECRCAASVQP